MPGGPYRGDRGEGTTRVEARRLPRLAGIVVLLGALGAMSVLAFDHRQSDLSKAWTALSDGRVTSVDSAGFTGPHSLVVVGHSSASVRQFPPVLARSTSVTPSRGPGGFALSPGGWALIRLGQLGHDKDGGEITEISPRGALVVTLPVLHWRDTALVGVTDVGLAVLRHGTTVSLMDSYGQEVPLLDLRGLGVTRDLANLADIALAPDGRIAVLVGTSRAAGGYRLFERLAGGAPDRDMRISRADLVDPRAMRPHQTVRPALAFAGADLVVVGNAGAVRVRDGRMRSRITVAPADRARIPLQTSSLVALRDGRLAIGNDPMLVLDASGHLHHPGFGPCPAQSEFRPSCPAVIAGHRVPRPADVLPDAAGVAVGVVLLALAWAGRAGRTEAARLRLAATAIVGAWVTVWLATSLAWGELHGSAPLLLLCGVALAILAPAFPAPARQDLEDDTGPTMSSYQPWITDRIAGRTPDARGAHLEVIPLPSRS